MLGYVTLRYATLGYVTLGYICTLDLSTVIYSPVFTLVLHAQGTVRHLWVWINYSIIVWLVVIGQILWFSVILWVCIERHLESLNKSEGNLNTYVKTTWGTWFQISIIHWGSSDNIDWNLVAYSSEIWQWVKNGVWVCWLSVSLWRLQSVKYSKGGKTQSRYVWGCALRVGLGNNKPTGDKYLYFRSVVESNP